MQDMMQALLQRLNQGQGAQLSTKYDNQQTPNAWGPNQAPANYQQMSGTNGLMQKAASGLLGNGLNNYAGYNKTAKNMAPAGMGIGTGDNFGSSMSSSGLMGLLQSLGMGAGLGKLISLL